MLRLKSFANLLAYLVLGSAIVQSAPLEAKDMSESDIQNLAGNLCRVLVIVQDRDGYDAGSQFTRLLTMFSGVDSQKTGSTIELAEFFNRHSPDLICRASNGMYPAQHFFKRAVEMNVHEEVLVDYFFRDPTNFPIDPNVLEVLPNGRISTVLDYIDSALNHPDARSRYNVDQVVEIRELLIGEFGAKRAEDVE